VCRWLWDDMPWNMPKRSPYWNSTSGFDFDHITAVDISFCTSLRNCIEIWPPSAELEVKVIWQKAPHGRPIPRLGVTPGGRKLYHWIPGVGFPIGVP